MYLTPVRQGVGRSRGVLVEVEARPCRCVSGLRYDSAVDLVIRRLDRTPQDVDALVDSYRVDDGLRYLAGG